MFGIPSSSQSLSRLSQSPSPFKSEGKSVAFSGSVPQFDSSISLQPSLSSSKSSISTGSLFEGGNNSFGCPSPSVSSQPAGSSGNASGPAVQLLVTGDSGPSHTPSPSVSGLVGEVPIGKPVSFTLSMPSPSISLSESSHIPSPSRSSGALEAFSGSEPQFSSDVSGYPSLSSSSSAYGGPVQSESLFGSPSPSVSTGKVGSSGKGSGPAKQTPGTALIPSQNPSPSVSGFKESVPSEDSFKSLEPSLSSSKSSVNPGGLRIESSDPL